MSTYLGCCVRLSLANPLRTTILSQLWPAMSTSRLQSFNPLHLFSALGRCVRLCHAILEFHVSPSADCCVRHCLAILCLSPSSQLHVACIPLHLSPCVYMCLPALDCCVCLCLAILCLPALDVTNSSCSVPILKNAVFGAYGGVIASCASTRPAVGPFPREERLPRTG